MKIDRRMSKNLIQLESYIQQNTATLDYLLNPSAFEDLDADGGIYICTYKKDDRYVYIGQTIDFITRWRQHSNDLVKSIHCGKFGKFFIKNHCEITDFEWKILQRIPYEQTILDAAERNYIRTYNSDGYHILLNSILYKKGGKKHGE